MRVGSEIEVDQMAHGSRLVSWGSRLSSGQWSGNTLKGVPTIPPEKLTGGDNATCPSVMRLLIRLVVKDSGNQQECSKECSLAP